ncbi:ferritin-like domain-containing protein [Roseospirillum parvum]|uniref:Bacterioferritin n=1 Tax=Roseospirillum parvum TaxID=83401 RepID=A0A1G8EKS5_9PROT|nr:ferritin-like domain-containing protein [Roseospirillum parvum]SDH70508.1 bacterioferritin [Roseospirillum parvum]
MYEKSIALLNEAVADELTAIHQYMYFHFHCDDQGLDLLAGMFRRTAIEEMMHVERLAERILFLKGDVVMKANQEVKSINEPDQMLAMTAELEERAIKMYNRLASQAREVEDSNTRKLFEDLVSEEEGHYDQFDNEVENLSKYGQQYLALQSIDRMRGNMGGGGGA